LLASASAELTNQLKNHPSPYLAMHGGDPVAWQPWNEEVLKLARKTNKLIFVSIGYFSCHWCHVMQRESYQDDKVAKRLNTDFIPVKVDRELDPALDAHLIDFVQKTRGYAGWPLNVFLTPEGHPVVGIVYLPNDQFRSLLIQLSDLWQKNNEFLRQTAAQASAQQRSESITVNAKLQQGIGKTLHAQLLQKILQAADDIQGGFGDQAKFPMPAQLNYLLDAYEQQPLDQIAHFLQLTLEQMASQGLRDHIGGGFFRYTVDPDWQTPHFEKMLYDNAQLASLYLDAAKVFKRKDFEVIARDTLDFMLREMNTDKSGMVASLSAVDDNNIEGGYYQWSKDALKKLLTEQEYDAVYILWNLEAAARFEAGYLPVYAISPEQAAKKLGTDVGEVMSILASVRSKLYAARQSRRIPVDDKQLTAWNGLALSAMIKGAQLKNGKKYRQAAQKLRHFLVNQMWDGRRLLRARSGAAEIAPGGLEDYAYAARGLLQWAWFVDSEQDQQLAKQWVNIAWQRFYTSTGWQLSDQLRLPGVFGSIVVEDNPMPSPSAIIIQTSLQLAERTRDTQLRQQAMGALAVSQEILKKQPFAYATQVKLLAQLQAAQNKAGRRIPSRDYN
jgi:uncharacterized protein YyaL (SSP411 family)